MIRRPSDNRSAAFFLAMTRTHWTVGALACLTAVAHTACASAEVSLFDACLESPGEGTDPVVPPAVILPSVVVDEDRDQVVTRRPEGEIVALQIKTGKTDWVSTVDGTPLLVHEGKLLTQILATDRPHTLHLSWLQSDSDEQNESLIASVSFPDWVELESAPGHSFHTEVRRQGSSAVLVWTAWKGTPGGAPPMVEANEPATRQGIAALELDLASSSTVTVCPDSEESDRWGGLLHTRGLPPAAPDLVGLQSERYWSGFEWRMRAFRSGPTVFAFEVQAGSVGKHLVVHRWIADTGEELAAWPISEGEEFHLQTSPDGRFLFFHDPTLRGSALRATWGAFDLLTGESAGQLTLPDATMAVNLVAGTWLALSEADLRMSASPGKGPRDLALEAIDPATGEPLWRTPIRGRHWLPLLP